MLNEFWESPPKVHILGLADKEFYIKKTLVFIGDIDAKIRDDILRAQKAWASGKSIPEGKLKSKFGPNWKVELGFIIGALRPDYVYEDTTGGSPEEDIVDDIMDLGDDFDQLDLFDETEDEKKDQKKIIEVAPVEEEALEDDEPETKSEVKTKKKKEAVKVSKKPRQLEFVDSVVIYPEDNIEEFKQKIYIADGIAPYEQHIYFTLRNNTVPCRYRITQDGQSVPVDIRRAGEETIADLPIDRGLHDSRENVTVEAYDQMITMEDIYSKYATNNFYLVSIAEYVDPRRNILEDLSTDRYQIELIYYSFILKFWPQMSFEIFLIYLKNPKEISVSYPELEPSKAKLTHRYDEEREVLTNKYELLADAHNGYKNNPKFRAYNPEFPIARATGAKGKMHVVNTSIRTATLTVEKERQYVRARFGLSIESQVKINVRNLFDELRITDDIPIIKVNLLNRRQQIILKKTRSPKMAHKEDIKSIFEQVKYQIQMPYYNTLLVVIRVRDEKGKIVRTAGDGRSKYIILVIYDNGKYHIRSTWNEDEKMDFEMVYSIMKATVDPVIESINQMGRLVFASVDRLNKINRGNSEFTELGMSLFWKQPLTMGQFQQLNDLLREEFKTGIIGAKEGNDQPYTYKLIKGVTGYDITQLDKYVSVNNYYSYMTDAAVRQKWISLFRQGRQMVLSQRTTDVKIEVQGIKEKEFKYFYHYIITFLFNAAGKVKGKAAASKELSVIKPGSKINTLKLLKAKDPEAFVFKQSGSDVVYSRICQKEHQPIPFTPDELQLLSSADQKRAVQFWNYTTQTPMYYICPNKKYSYLSFITGSHPKNYCLPCCKKTPPYSSSVDSSPDSKKSRIYKTCMDTHEFTEEEFSSSRYVMNYGKDIYIGRIGKLPDTIQQYLLYNLENVDILSEFTIARTFTMDKKKYSVDRLFKITRNIKIHKVPLSDLEVHLGNKSWEYKREGVGDIAPMEVIKEPNKNRRFSKHYGRIMNADMSYPILVYKNKDDGWSVIVDGLHRLARAYIEKSPTIKVRYVTNKQLDKVLISEMDEGDEHTIGVSNDPPAIASVEKIDKVEKKKKPPKTSRKQKKAKRGGDCGVCGIAQERSDADDDGIGGGAVDEKKPGYYLYGVPQNNANVDNIGVLYSLAIALNMEFSQFIQFTIKILQEDPMLFKILLNGELNRYFSNLNDLITLMRSVFLTNKISLNTVITFDSWNELFIDIAKVGFDKTVIIFDDTSIITTGTSMKVSVSDDINLILPGKVQYIEDIIPEQSRNYILLLQRRKKSKSAFEKHEKVYYPIFIFVPYTFFKMQTIEKRVYTQNDEIMKLVTNIIRTKLEDKASSRGIARDTIDFHIIAEFLADKQYKIDTIYANSKDMCYAVVLNEAPFGKNCGQVYVPVAYSYYNEANAFLGEDESIYDIVDYAPFSRSNHRLSASSLKTFIERFNRFVVKKSEEAGMFKLKDSSHKTAEDKVIPIYPLIKMRRVLVLGDKIIGLMSRMDGVIHYYVNDVKGAGATAFHKTFSTGYNVFEDGADAENHYLMYDPDTINNVVMADDKPVVDRRVKILARAVYKKQLYQLFVMEFIRYFDKDRNTALRSKLTKLVNGTNFKNEKNLQKFRDQLSLILEQFPDDLTRIQEQTNVFYNTYFDKKVFMDEIKDSVYKFDRTTLIDIMKEVQDFWSNSPEVQIKQKEKVVKELEKIASKLVKFGEPKFHEGDVPPNMLMACADGSDYCASGKLLIPEEMYRQYLDLFADDMLNPLKNQYIMALIFTDNIIDYFRFKRMPGEELYVKF